MKPKGGNIAEESRNRKEAALFMASVGVWKQRREVDGPLAG